MKLRIVRNYLDYEKGKAYNFDSLSTAKYLIAMGVAKEVVSKDGKEVDVEPTPKKKVAKTSKKQTKEAAKVEIKETPKKEIAQPGAAADFEAAETAEASQTVSNEAENNAAEDFKKNEDLDDLLGFN